MFRNIFIAVAIVIAIPVFNNFALLFRSVEVNNTNYVVNIEESITNSSFEENLDKLVFEESNLFSTFGD